MSQTTTPAGRELETSTIRAIGWVKEATGSTSTGLLVLAVLPLFGGFWFSSVVTRPRWNSRQPGRRSSPALAPYRPDYLGRFSK
jgi:hypothetical protein